MVINPPNSLGLFSDLNDYILGVELTYVQYIDNIISILFKYGTTTSQILCCSG
jgi:hypothetical protein